MPRARRVIRAISHLGVYSMAYDINTRVPDEPTVYHSAKNAHRAEVYLTAWIRKNLPSYTDAEIIDTLQRVKSAGLGAVTISRREGLYMLSMDEV